MGSGERAYAFARRLKIAISKRLNAGSVLCPDEEAHPESSGRRYNRFGISGSTNSGTSTSSGGVVFNCSST